MTFLLYFFNDNKHNFEENTGNGKNFFSTNYYCDALTKW